MKPPYLKHVAEETEGCMHWKHHIIMSERDMKFPSHPKPSVSIDIITKNQ